MGIAYQLGANLIRDANPACLSRFLGGQISPHPDNDNDSNNKRKALALLCSYTVIPKDIPPHQNRGLQEPQHHGLDSLFADL